MKKAGIVSGIGPASAVEYYNGIILGYKKIHGQGVNPEIVIDSINMYDFDTAFASDDFDKVSAMLLKSINNLARAGADFAAVACNTAHIVWGKIAGKTDIPLISIVEETCGYIAGKGCKRTVILASGTTIRNGMYSAALKKIGVDPVVPDGRDAGVIADIIYPGLENGIVTDDAKSAAIGIAEKYIKLKNADSVLLGCTELPLLIQENDLPTTVNLIDTVKIHIAAILREIER